MLTQTTKKCFKPTIRQHKYDCQEKNNNKTEKIALALHYFKYTILIIVIITLLSLTLILFSQNILKK